MDALKQKSGIYYASRNSTALDLAKLMREKNIGILPIVDESRLVGVVSERDLVVQVLAVGKDPTKIHAYEIMTPDPIVADAKDPWETILGKMKQINARHMLIMSDGILAGVLSLRDFLLANINAGHAELKTTHDVPYVDSKTDMPAVPIDVAVWRCKACGFLAFGPPRHSGCLGCGMRSTCSTGTLAGRV